jgi:hypothetical protein
MDGKRDDGQGYIFKHRDGDVSMEGCPVCGSDVIGDQGSGFHGFWLSVGWSPNADSPPGLQAWSTRIVEENDGVVTLRHLEPRQLHQACNGGRSSLLWSSVVVLSSELARLQARVAALEQQRDHVRKALFWSFIAVLFGVVALAAGFVAGRVGP